MSRTVLPLILWLCAIAAIAQPMRNADAGSERQAEREQRRLELRRALRPDQRAEVQNVAVNVAVPAERHLSPRERAEMREQLRLQQNGNRRSAP